MYLFRNSILIACCIELPLFALLVLSAGGDSKTLWCLAIVSFHIISIGLPTYLGLFYFGHSAPSVGPLWAWHITFFLLAYVIQVALISPLEFLSLRHKANRRERCDISDGAGTS